VAVSTPHRKEGSRRRRRWWTFKEVVPVWKKEVWEDGEEWIEGEPVKH
jgi:molybdopterin synthase catalytic subunit